MVVTLFVMLFFGSRLLSTQFLPLFDLVGMLHPPPSFGFGASVSPTLLSARRRSLLPYKVGLPKSVTNAMQEDTQDGRVWCNLQIACQGHDRDAILRIENCKANNAPRRHPPMMGRTPPMMVVSFCDNTKGFRAPC